MSVHADPGTGLLRIAEQLREIAGHSEGTHQAGCRLQHMWQQRTRQAFQEIDKDEQHRQARNAELQRIRNWMHKIKRPVISRVFDGARELARMGVRR